MPSHLLETLKYPIDLAHIFTTDVRILRLSEPMAIPSDVTDSAAFINDTLRGAAEAIRLAAADLLGTDPRDLRATFESGADDYLIILADSTPGGAGYARRLVDEPSYSARRLLSKALEILDCERGEKCQTSCVKCLNDYSNQAYWDRFNRHSSLKWLAAVLARSTARPDHVPVQAIPSDAPSGDALSRYLSNRDQAVVVAKTLWGAEAEEGAIRSAQRLRDWLEAEPHRKAIVFCTTPDEGNASWMDRQVAAILRPMEDAARLTFPRMPDAVSKGAPRLTLFGNGDMEELFDAEDHAAALAGLGEGVIFRCTRAPSDTWAGRNAVKIIEAAKTKTSYLSTLIDRLSIYRFRPGDIRNLEPAFSSLSGRLVRMRIEDPWCAARQHGRESVSNFLTQLQTLDISIGELKVVWNSDNSDGSAAFQASELRSEIELNYTGELVMDPRRRHEVRHFHDRVVYFDVDETGESWRVDISAGIDNLMSRSKECSVFIERK